MEKSKCTIHTINPMITDQDLTALFEGLIDVVKKKYELDYSARIMNLDRQLDILTKLIKEKDLEIMKLREKLNKN